MAKFYACILSIVATVALSERFARTKSYRQFHLGAGELTPDEEFDAFLKSAAIPKKKCGCGDAKCLDHYKSALIETKRAAASSALLQEQNAQRSKKGGSVITLHWAGKQTLDYHQCFLRMWTAMPVTPSSEFKIVGTLYDIMKDLDQKPDLTTSSPSDYNNKPLYLCIARPMEKATVAFIKAFGGNWAGIGGIATLFTLSAQIFGAGEAATLLHGLASNPSDFNLDAAIDYVIDKKKSSKFKVWRSRITGSKMIAWLSLARCQAPVAIKFKVRKIGDRHSATWETGGGQGKPLTAKHISGLIAMASR